MTTPTPPTRSHERLLFLGSGLLLLGAVVVGLAREQHWGQRFLDLRLVAANANGIKPGQEVQISGMQVGQVRSLEMLPHQSLLSLAGCAPWPDQRRKFLGDLEFDLHLGVGEHFKRADLTDLHA